ncbi:MAG: hypothetical protein VX453_12945 [Acidobacteriota bacterium]|nr:hypothetical protein [Acidobacteriota bacterium]
MTRTGIVVPVAACLLISVSMSFAQDMPPGAVVQVLPCTLNQGYTVQDAVRVARSLRRDENSPNAAFIREPLNVDPTFSDRYDLVGALYYPSFSDLISRRDAEQADTSPSMAPRTRLQDVVTCNFAASTIRLSRAIPETDGFTGGETLMTVRYCELDEGRTVSDAFEFVEGIAAAYRAEDSNLLMQVTTPRLGNRLGRRAGTRLTINTVASTSTAMAERLDLTSGGFNPTAGLTNPMSCSVPALWRTYATYRRSN